MLQCRVRTGGPKSARRPGDEVAVANKKAPAGCADRGLWCSRYRTLSSKTRRRETGERAYGDDHCGNRNGDGELPMCADERHYGFSGTVSLKDECSMMRRAEVVNIIFITRFRFSQSRFCPRTHPPRHYPLFIKTFSTFTGSSRDAFPLFYC